MLSKVGPVLTHSDGDEELVDVDGSAAVDVKLVEQDLDVVVVDLEAGLADALRELLEVEGSRPVVVHPAKHPVGIRVSKADDGGMFRKNERFSKY